MRIALAWNGVIRREGWWKDGLWAAMKEIEKQHEVRYFDFPLEGINEFNPDIVLYWEAPVTQRGPDAWNWFAITELPYPKALLFAGGPLKSIDVVDFDLVFVESQINVEDCEREGIPHRKAFGVNTQIMCPQNVPIRYEAIHHGTFAEWKRQDLFAQTMGDKGLCLGKVQVHDRNGYNECLKRKVTVIDEVKPEEVSLYINASRCVLNTSSFWGGGQRCTLEGMACGKPVLVMSDSTKNCEYVQESDGGLICEPTKESILENLAKVTPEMGVKAYEYIQSKYTEKHYANAILNGIMTLI